jgi:putative aldouronate transport system substrate-binding protein
MKAWIKSGFTVLSAVALAVSVLAACSSSGKSPASQGTDKDSGAPAEITWMVPLFQPQPPLENGEPMKKLQQMTNTKLSLNWVPSTTYMDKLTVSIASNDLPMIVSMSADNQLRHSAIVNAVKSGLFWELGPYLKDYPNLSKLNQQILDNTSYEGKIYGIYRERDLSKHGVSIRKDWLDNLGLKEPKTIDDIYAIAKAFTLNDPDKNGKNDTIGIAESKDVGILEDVSAWMGAPNQWGVVQGKLVPEATTPEYLNAMNFVRKLSAEKLMNQDFMLLDANQRLEQFAKGKAGLMIGNVDDVRKASADLLKITPTAKVTYLNRIEGPKGARIFGSGGHAGLVMIPKTNVKTEAELKKVLSFLDVLNSKEGVDVLAYGILGRHYELVDGKARTLNNDLFKTEVQGLGLLTMSKISLTDKLPANKDEESTEAIKKGNTKIAIANPAESLESKTAAERGAALNKEMDDARNKYLIGAIDEAGWKKALEDWRKAGGDQVTKELNAEYANAQKNKGK